MKKIQRISTIFLIVGLLLGSLIVFADDSSSCNDLGTSGEAFINCVFDNDKLTKENINALLNPNSVNFTP